MPFLWFLFLNSQLSSEKQLAYRKVSHSSRSVSKLQCDMSVVGDFIEELRLSCRISKSNLQRFNPS